MQEWLPTGAVRMHRVRGHDAPNMPIEQYRFCRLRLHAEAQELPLSTSDETQMVGSLLCFAQAESATFAELYDKGLLAAEVSVLLHLSDTSPDVAAHLLRGEPLQFSAETAEGFPRCARRWSVFFSHLRSPCCTTPHSTSSSRPGMPLRA